MTARATSAAHDSAAEDFATPAATGREPPERAAIERLLDANLDRAREGLRVLEDWARFGLDRPDLVARTKDLRQRLGRLHRFSYKAARHTATDPAAGMTHPAQNDRLAAGAVVAANAGRVQEALRVLEEFARGIDAELAAEAAAVRYRLYDLEVDLLQAPADGDARRRLLRDCHLYLITSPHPDLERIVEAALEAGVRLVQYRAKSGGDAAVPGPDDDLTRYRQARELRRLCRRHGALFLVNDRVDLALAVDADGVHLGQGDLPATVARKLLGPARLLGRSTHAIEELRQAVVEGCDYVGVGPVHATPTKPGRPAVGIEYVRRAVAESPLPCFAIGGIDAAAVAAVRAAGAERVAVVRAVIGAADPGEATAGLLRQLEAER
jgi:thiamine-phosphate pyrophosphorylase